MLSTRGAAAQAAIDEPETTFSAEVTVTHTMIDRTGARVRELPPSRYRLERREGGALRLTMLATRSTPASGPLADRYAGVTVEAGDDGLPRVRDAHGEALAAPVPPSPGLAPIGDGDGLIARVSDREARLEQLTRRYGRPAGSVGALSRYIGRQGRTTEEVLVAPDTALPVELNRLEGGVLVEQHRFEYAPIGGLLIRAGTRSESALADGSGGRMVSVTTLSAIAVGGGAR
jgi:hypothetical protein